MITSALRVRRWRCGNKFESVQVLERVTFWRGITIWVAEVDREVVPTWASIQRGALGYTDWRSKFADIPDVEWVRA